LVTLIPQVKPLPALNNLNITPPLTATGARAHGAPAHVPAAASVPN
jgi:hypothetical protein